MDKNTIIVIVLVALILVSVVQAIQLTTLKNKITGNAVNSDNLDSDQSYEEMMAEMHPELYGRATQNTGPTMVGGC